MMETTDQHPPEQRPADLSAGDLDGERRGVGEYVREAWSQALVAVGAAEEEVQKIVGRLTGWASIGPDEAKRLGVELTEKLQRERDELENTVETAVRRAVAPFRLPTREDVALLDQRLNQIEARLDRLLADRHGA